MTVALDEEHPLTSPTESRIRATLRGWNPILFDACSEQAVRELILREVPVELDPETGKPKKRSRKKVEAAPSAPSTPLTREAITELCRGKIPMHEGKPGIPANYLFAALEHALGYDRRHAKAITRGLWIPLSSVLSLNEEFLFFKGEPTWVVDQRRGKNGPIHRPRFDQWSVAVNFTAERSVMDLGNVRRLFYVAGRFVGLGAFRPGLMQFGTEMLELPGRAPIARTFFGQFRIANWTVDGKDVTFTKDRNATASDAIVD